MNVFRRELKAHRWGLLFWCIGMFALIASGMAKYSAYSQVGQSAQEVLDQLPRTIQVVFGMTGFDLTKASGFFGVLFLYLALMGAVHASLLGSQIIAEEERDKTSEFLFSKPLARPAALTAKLLAGLLNVIVLNLVTAASSFYFVGLYGGGESITQEILVMMGGLFFLQLIFFAIGAAVAGASNRPKSAASRATSIMFVTFLLSYVVNLNEKLDALKYLTPFKYFDAATMLADGRLELGYVALATVIVVACVVVAYRTFGARDLRV
ncbi:MAG: ABC transporter permease subunit [Coriobacteriia bacterium]